MLCTVHVLYLVHLPVLDLEPSCIDASRSSFSIHCSHCGRCIDSEHCTNWLSLAFRFGSGWERRLLLFHKAHLKSHRCLDSVCQFSRNRSLDGPWITYVSSGDGFKRQVPLFPIASFPEVEYVLFKGDTTSHRCHNELNKCNGPSCWLILSSLRHACHLSSCISMSWCGVGHIYFDDNKITSIQHVHVMSDKWWQDGCYLAVWGKWNPLSPI